MNLKGRIGQFIARAALLVGVLLAGNNGLANEAHLRAEFVSHGDDLVEITLTNISGDSLSVLSWGTPFESVISHDIFDIRSTVSGTQSRLVYKGRSAKRGSPLPEDFIILAAGESLQQFLSLSVYYDIPEQGEYSLRYAGPVLVDLPVGLDHPDQNRTVKSAVINDGVDSQLQSTIVDSEVVILDLVPPPETRAARVPAYFSCSAAQQSELVTALRASEVITTAARDGLVSLVGDARLNSPRYRNWFGEYSSDRFDTVLDTFSRASAVIAEQQIEFDCSCDEVGLFAYVFPSDPYRIYPCPSFWEASVNGTDSRAGTILHELTHFPSILGTDDFEYGKTDVELLAVNNPGQAVTNADSYEYFAENSPNIPISNFLVFSDMTVGVTEASDLPVGESTFYKVSGADYIELVSSTGDADLYVYDSASINNLICESVSISGFDRCDLNSGITSYIEVRGYIAAQYSLIAKSNTPQPQPESQPEPEPILTTEGGVENTVGGNGGENPSEQSGGGAIGASLFMLLVFRRWRQHALTTCAGFKQ